MVKIESVSAEIFLIWANINRTNVYWTNITIMVGNLASLKDGSRNLPLKIGQHFVSNSWDILIWTNFPSTNITWTNVNLILGVCSRCSQLHSKFHQNRASNDWDFPYMDKSHQDKCCLDNCQLDIWICSRYSQDATFKASSKSGH